MVIGVGRVIGVDGVIKVIRVVRFIGEVDTVGFHVLCDKHFIQ